MKPTPVDIAIAIFEVTPDANSAPELPVFPGSWIRYFHPAHGELVYTTLIEWLFVSGSGHKDEATLSGNFLKAARSACGGYQPYVPDTPGRREKRSPQQRSCFIMGGICPIRNISSRHPDSMIRLSGLWGNPGNRQFSSVARSPEGTLRNRQKGVMLQKSE